MQITCRQFYNTAELKEMIKGFEMLFGYKPIVRIEVRGSDGLPSGTTDIQTGEIAFFPSAGYQLEKAGNKVISVIIGPDAADRFICRVDDNLVTFHAAFYF